MMNPFYGFFGKYFTFNQRRVLSVISLHICIMGSFWLGIKLASFSIWSLQGSTIFIINISAYVVSAMVIFLIERDLKYLE